MRAVIDGGSLDSREALHRALKEQLSLPDWYGNNLDALHDCLTSLHEPVELEIKNAGKLRESLGGYVSALCHVLCDSEKENGNLTVLWEE